MRRSIPLLTILAAVLQAPQTDACCLTDWLCGRSTPYVVGYAPVATATYSAGYAPVATTTYAAGYAPVAASPYAAGYAPVATSPYAAGYSAAPTTSVLSPTMAVGTVPAPTNGAYQVQRPTYYDNPSVYTGLPVATENAQTSYRVPITSTLRGTGPALPSLGPGNQYPQAYQAGYVSAYQNAALPGQPITTTTPSGTLLTANPPTAVAPVLAAPPSGCGLGRFCGSLFGTSYRTSYYRAPVTYYRPVTSIDPVSGTTVTVQQPCTSYTQQLQRTPYANFQLGQPAMVQPSTDCATSAPVAGSAVPYTISPYGQAAPYGVAPSGGIGQVGGISSTGPTTIPIPSTAPAPDSYYAQPGYAPNMSPLTGAPPTLAPQTSAPSSGGDLAPVGQPQLNSSPAPGNLRRESTDSPSGTSGGSSSEPPLESPKSFWQLQDAEDSTAMIGSVSRSSQPRRDPASLSGTVTAADPIQAPADYISPFRSHSIEVPAPPVTGPTFEAPPLPARTHDSWDATSVSTTSAVVREAALIRARAPRQPSPQKRDSTWYPIGQ